MRVAITEDVFGAEYEELATEYRVDRDENVWKLPDILPEFLKNADAVIVRNRTRVDKSFFEAAPQLKVLARAGVGLDNVDVEAADAAGVVVVAPLGANARSVAEHAMMMALALSKSVLGSDADTKLGRWKREATEELGGKTWGMLSAGATARATARLAKAFGMRVIAYDPYLDPGHPELREIGIELCSLDEVLAAAQVLSIHLPNTESTRHLLNAERLNQLQEGALLISVGRGEVIDEAALVDALDSGRVGGAGLDVRETEPPQTGTLEGRKDVILTPHVAGISVQAQNRIAQVLCREIRLVLSGDEATSAVGSVTRAVKS